MIVRNLTKTVYSFEGKFIMPNQAVNLPDETAENPIFNNLVKAKKFSIEKSNTKVISDASEAQEQFEALLANNPSSIKLKNFAKRNGIALNEAATDEDIIAIIKASITLAGL